MQSWRLHRYRLVRTTIVRLKRNGNMHYVQVYSEFSAHKRCFVCCVISLYDNTLDIFRFLVKCFLCGLLLTAGSTFYLKSSVCNVGLVSFFTSALSQYLYIGWHAHMRTPTHTHTQWDRRSLTECAEEEVETQKIGWIITASDKAFSHNEHSQAGPCHLWVCVNELELVCMCVYHGGGWRLLDSSDSSAFSALHYWADRPLSHSNTNRGQRLCTPHPPPPPPPPLVLRGGHRHS